MKELQLLTEAAQTKQIIYLLTDATKDTPASRAVREAARQLGVDLRPAVAQGAIDEASISRALSDASPEPGMALFVHPAVVLRPFAGFIASQALKFHLPTLSNSREGAEAGFVLSYIALDDEAYRGVAAYIARIAGGSKPADLPVQQPEQYDFVVDLKTAKALGMTIPMSIVARATQVIE